MWHFTKNGRHGDGRLLPGSPFPSQEDKYKRALTESLDRGIPWMIGQWVLESRVPTHSAADWGWNTFILIFT